MKRNIYVMILAAMLCATMVSIGAIEMVAADGEDSSIYITSNGDFTTYALNGSGILADPYILGEFAASSHKYAEVYIINTDAVFILENFNISHDNHENEGSGIYLQNVTNALIRDGNIVGKEHSIWIKDCENLRVARMYISNRVPGFDDGYSNFDLITASGIVVEDGLDIELRDNDIRRVKVGIHLMDSLDAVVTDNDFRYSCISMVGGSGAPMNYTVTGNTVNNKPIVYAYNLTNGVYSGASYGQIILDHCTHIAVEYANLSYATIGLEINHCYEIRIKDSNMTRNWIGINAYMSEAIDILRCRVEYNMIGGHAWDTHNVTVRDSSFAHNVEKAIWLDLMTSASTVFGNIFLNNTVDAVDNGIPDDYVPDPETSDVGFVRVRVVDDYNNAVLVGANITLSNSTHIHSLITGVTGVRTFPGLELGDYNITCTRGDYFSNEIAVTLTDVSWGYDSDIALSHVAWVYDQSDEYVEIYVKDAGSEAPISGADILLEGVTNHGMLVIETFITDESGFANFTNIYLGMYNYTFSASGYVDASGTLNLTVNVVTPRTIHLTRNNPDTGVIRVTVLDSFYEQPLSGINVTLSNTTHSHSIETSVAGMFTFNGLAYGTYNLSCEADDYLTNLTELTLTSVNWGYDFNVGLVYDSLTNTYVEIYVLVNGTATPITDVFIDIIGTTNHGLPVSVAFIADDDGFANFTDVYLGVYNYIFAADGYVGVMGSWDFSTSVETSKTIYMVAAEPEGAGFMLSGDLLRTSNRWYEDSVGNYWATFSGVGSYEIEGYYANNYDIYPLDGLPEFYQESLPEEEVDLEPEPIPEPEITDTVIIPVPTTTTEPKPDIEVVQDMAMLVVGIVGVIAVIVVLFVIKEKLIK